MNLRPLAHYGIDPVPWVAHLSEAFFQVLIGSVSDPGYRSERSTILHQC